MNGINMITIIILLISTIGILSYISYNLFKKVETLEQIVDSQEQYISGVSSSIKKADKKLQEIDDKGTFKSDDEIGWFFESVKTLQNELNDFNTNNDRNTK
jgi:cell division protein FtsL